MTPGKMLTRTIQVSKYNTTMVHGTYKNVNCYMTLTENKYITVSGYTTTMKHETTSIM